MLRTLRRWSRTPLSVPRWRWCPRPGSRVTCRFRVVQHRSGRQPWRVVTVTGDGAMLCNPAGAWARMPLTALEPDQVERTPTSTGQGD